MKFAILSDNTANQVNGAAEVTRQLVHVFGQNYHEVLLITPKESIHYAQNENDSIELFSIPFWNYKECRISLPFSIKALERIKSFNPDFIITTTPFGIGQFGVLIKQFLKIPLINFILTDFTALNKYYGYKQFDSLLSKIQTHICRNAIQNFVPSEFLKNKLFNNGIENVHSFELGLGNQSFIELKEHHASNITSSYKRLLYVGRVAPDKNIMSLIEYVKNKSNVKLTVAGDGPLMKKVKDLPMEKFEFLGYKKGKELAMLYKNSDLFVMPSLEEVGGMAVLEAIYSRIPVLIYNGKATKEIINKYNSFDFRTNKEFYSQMNSLIETETQSLKQTNTRINFLENNWIKMYDMIIETCFFYYQESPAANRVDGR